MLHLEAICVGYAVPRHNFDAEIHSVFTSAANFRLVNNGPLLTLVTVEQADLPQGIRVDTPQGFSFEGLRTGESITYRNDILCCERASLVIDLRQSRRWKCDLLALAVDMNESSTLAAWQSVKQVL